MTQDRAHLSPAGFHRRIPLTPDRLVEPITPARDLIVLCHLGVPQLEAESWSLAIDGLVERPLRLTLADLERYPITRIEAVHQCAGSPLEPRVPTRRVGNVVWGGVRLATVLAEAGMRPEARFVWSRGADWGAFQGVESEAYLKDLPLARALDDALLAFELNGRALSAEHGYPVRLVVPGYFGTNSVKWLQRMTLADRRAGGPFVTRWYNDPVLDAEGRETGATAPVWSLHPEALIVAPAPAAHLPRGVPATVWGWAWGDQPIAHVEIGVSGSGYWQPARIEPRRSRAWQQFSADWTPTRPGPARLAARATDAAGATQPAAGWRNAIHTIDVVID